MVGTPKVSTGDVCADVPRKLPKRSYAENKAHYLDKELTAACSGASSAKMPQEKAAFLKQAKALKGQRKEQGEIASFKELNDGRLRMTIKKNTKVGDLQKLFDLQDGSLRNNPDVHMEGDFKWHEYPEGTEAHDEGRQYRDYSGHVLKQGEKITIEPNQIHNQGYLKEFWNSLTGK